MSSAHTSGMSLGLTGAAAAPLGGLVWGEQYSGTPGLGCFTFLRQQHLQLNQHALQSGGNVQYTYMFSLLKAAVSEASGLVQPMEEFLQLLHPTYLQDARRLQFNRPRLLSLPPEVLQSLHRHYRGPPITAHELEAQVLRNLGTTQGANTIAKYIAGRSHQPPTPYTEPAAAETSGAAAMAAALSNTYLRCQQQSEHEVAEIRHELHHVTEKLSRAEQRHRQQRAEATRLRTEKRQLQAQLFEEFKQLVAEQVQRSRDEAAATAQAAPAAAAPTQTEITHASPVPPARAARVAQGVTRSPVGTRSRTRMAASDGAAGSASSDLEGREGVSSSDEEPDPTPRSPAGHPAAVPPVAIRRGLAAYWDTLEGLPARFDLVQAMATELLSPMELFDDNDATLRVHLPGLQHQRWPEDALQPLRLVHQQLCQVDALIPGQQDTVEEAQAVMERRATRRGEVVLQLQRAEGHLLSVIQQATQHQLAQLQVAAGTEMVPNAPQLPVFEAYLHPDHPELLVTPGTLVVLLLFELVRVRCAYMPGANTLRHDPPKQQYGKDSLVQYGQLFKQMAKVCGQEDSANTLMQLYLQGLADSELRESYYKSLMRNPTHAPTTLEATIAAVEAKANGELTILGQRAEVGGAVDKQKFRDKQMYVCPAVVTGTAVQPKAGVRFSAQPRVQGEVSPAWVASIFPAAKGSEQQLLDAPCLIHAQGGGRPHKLAECEFAKSLAALPTAQARQQLKDYQAARVIRHVSPSASMVMWDEEEAAHSVALSVDHSTVPDGMVGAANIASATPSVPMPPPDDPDQALAAHVAIGALTAGANGLPAAVAAAALGTGNQQYTRSPAVRQAYEAACQSAPVPSGPLPAPTGAAPCPTCGRQQGHGQGICFPEHPDCAPDFYKGPLMSDGPQAEKTFLRAVASRRPHSRYQQAVAQGLVVPRGRTNSSAAGGAPGRHPPSRLLQRPQSIVRAAAAATVEHLGCDDDEGELTDAEYRGACADCCAAQPIGFTVEDHATFVGKEQPAPGPQRLPVDHAAVSSQLQHALDKGDMSQQLFAVAQGMQTLVAEQKQLGAESRACLARVDTLERLLSAHWQLPLPVKQGNTPVTDSPAVADPSVPGAAAAAPSAPHEPGSGSPHAATVLGDTPPADPAERAEWARRQLSLALNTDDGSYIMDRPRYDDPARGLVVVTPDGVPVTSFRTMFDTGCTVDIVTEAALEKAGIPWVHLPHATCIRLANGAQVPLLGVTATFTVVLRQGTNQQLTTTVRALVLGSVSDGTASLGYDLLLGKGWFAKHHVNLMLAQHRVTYVADNGQPGLMLLHTKLRFRQEGPAVLSVDVRAAAGVVSADMSDDMSQHDDSDLPGLISDSELEAEEASLSAPAVVAVAACAALVEVPDGMPHDAAEDDADVPDLCVSSDWASEDEKEADLPLPTPAFAEPGAASSSATPRVQVRTAQALRHPATPGQHLRPIQVTPEARRSPARVTLGTRVLLPGSSRPRSRPTSPGGSGGAEVVAGMAATGTQPSPLLPGTQQALPSGAQGRPYYPGEFNPLQELGPVAEPDGLDPDLVEDPVHGWHVGASLSPEQRQQLDAVLRLNLAAFAFAASDLVGYTGSDGTFEGVRIPLREGTQRVYEAERRYSQQHMQIQDEKCAEMLRLEWIRQMPTTTPFASNSTCPGKKDEHGNWTDKRFCIDFRPLNEATVPDNYRMPMAEVLFNSLGEPRYLTTLDLRSGFHQLPMHPDSIALTSFWWRRQLYAYTRMPFGLRNATAVFQRIVDEELSKAGLCHCAKVFVDDVLIHSDSFEEHLEHLGAVLQCFWRAGLRVHPRKSYFRH